MQLSGKYNMATNQNKTMDIIQHLVIIGIPVRFQKCVLFLWPYFLHKGRNVILNNSGHQNGVTESTSKRGWFWGLFTNAL